MQENSTVIQRLAFDEMEENFLDSFIKVLEEKDKTQEVVLNFDDFIDEFSKMPIEK